MTSITLLLSLTSTACYVLICLLHASKQFDTNVSTLHTFNHAPWHSLVYFPLFDRFICYYLFSCVKINSFHCLMIYAIIWYCQLPFTTFTIVIVNTSVVRMYIVYVISLSLYYCFDIVIDIIIIIFLKNIDVCWLLDCCKTIVKALKESCWNESRVILCYVSCYWFIPS